MRVASLRGHDWDSKRRRATCRVCGLLRSVAAEGLSSRVVYSVEKHFDLALGAYMRVAGAPQRDLFLLYGSALVVYYTHGADRLSCRLAVQQGEWTEIRIAVPCPGPTPDWESVWKLELGRLLRAVESAACPRCRAPQNVWCHSLSGHAVPGLHAPRRVLVDEVPHA
jgi:hypothetical protein